MRWVGGTSEESDPLHTFKLVGEDVLFSPESFTSVIVGPNAHVDLQPRRSHSYDVLVDCQIYEALRILVHSRRSFAFDPTE